MPVCPIEFTVNPSSGVPIFRQLMEQVHALVLAEKLGPGDMLPSTRELARGLEINMMTVSKAYSRLEADGVIRRMRGRGMQVNPQQPKGTLTQRKTEFRIQISPSIQRGRQLGLNDEQIIAIIRKVLREERK